MDRMAAVKVAVLLLLAAVGSNAAPNTAECDGFTKKMSIKDLDKVSELLISTVPHIVHKIPVKSLFTNF